MIEIIKRGRLYTEVKFLRTIYSRPGMIKYMEGEIYLIPNLEVKYYEGM